MSTNVPEDTNRVFHPPISPALALFAGIFAVSTSSIFIRLAQREAPSLAIAVYRLGLASLFLLPVVWKRRADLVSLTRKQWGLLVLSGAFLAVHFATWITSLAFTSVASSVVLVTTTPLWVALFSPVFLREKLDRKIWAGLAIAVSGGVIVGLNEVCSVGAAGIFCRSVADLYQGQATFGNFLALAGAWMAAGYMIVGRKVRTALSLTTYIGTVYPFAAFFLAMLAIANGTRMSGYAPDIYLMFLGLALIPQLMGHTSYNYALGYLPAAYVSVAVLAEPIGSSLLAMLVLGENPTTIEIIGGGIILLGIGMASWKK